MPWKMPHLILVKLCFLLLVACSGPQSEEMPAEPRSGEAVVAASSDRVENGEWLTWGGDAGVRRYTPLDQINADNATELQIVWRWQSLPWETRPDINLKATPLYVDGLLFAPVGVNQVVALDPATGNIVWQYDPDPAVIKGRSEAVSSRAVAYWTDGEEKRLFHNTRDGRLLSIDAKTGRADTAFGEQGAVYLRFDLRPDGEPVPFVGSSSPPAIVGDVVIAQVVADITPQNKEGTPGHIRGYDVRSGELLWTFHTIPQSGEAGNETWADDSWKTTGNNGVWSMMSVDEARGLVYLPVEAPSHDFYGGHRIGDNLYSQSLVCLNGKTGERVWHFQMVHHGLWDYDPPAAPILHDIIMGGRTIPAVTQITKQGMSFVFNRVTGEPVWPIEERAVPQSSVPGEKTSPTQPFPTKPEYYLPGGYDENQLIDFTPALRAEALDIAENYVRGPIYTPPSIVSETGTKGTWVQPSYGGGGNWNGAAFDPETQLMFVPNRNEAFVAGLGRHDGSQTNWDYLRLPTGRVPGPGGLPILKPPYSSVTATDMSVGTHVWTRSIGEAPAWIRDHPALVGLDLDFENMGHPYVRPVPLVTRSLFFMAESGNLFGDPGGRLFRAYDKETGATVAEIELPTLVSGGPMSYLHEGRQYIVMAIASAEHPAELVALALPTAAEKAAGNVFLDEAAGQAAQPQLPPQPRATFAADVIIRGRDIYDANCAACHGVDGEGFAGVIPSITPLRDVNFIAQQVAAGGIEMPAFNTVLSEQEIYDVAAYVAAGFPDENGETP